MCMHSTLTFSHFFSIDTNILSISVDLELNMLKSGLVRRITIRDVCDLCRNMIKLGSEQSFTPFLHIIRNSLRFFIAMG